jgi:hypothetical protein
VKLTVKRSGRPGSVFVGAALLMMFAAPHVFGHDTSAPLQSTPQMPPLAYDAVSVRSDKSGRRIGIQDDPHGDGILMHSIPLDWVIKLAYDIQGSGMRSGRRSFRCRFS